jgi:predicted enzyme related to lactoylglutathione lyase
MELRIVRPTDRFDEAAAFYGELLGWPVTRQWDEPERGRIFGYGDTGRVELLEAASTDAVTGLLVSIEVDDVDALAVRLTGRVPITRAPADQPWGHRNFGIIDPTGLPIVFFHVL